MADPSSRRGSLRLPRVRGGNSRNSSLRASALYDEYRQPSGSHPLRNASSRYSLNEQFASTRQEYELWDDDASSIFERATNASEAGETEGERILVNSVDDFGVLYDADALGPESSLQDWDYYDILCLPRDADLSQDQIRRAYYRLFLLFYPDSYPEHLRPIARQQFLHAQEAFETLIDPARRTQYDASQSTLGDDSSELTDHEVEYQEAAWKRIHNGVHTSTDMGLRIDATSYTSRDPKRRRRYNPLRLLDFALSHSASVRLGRGSRIIDSQNLLRLKRATAQDIEGSEQRPVEVFAPTLTVTGSVYGVGEDQRSFPPALVYDRYQPLLPHSITRERLRHLVEHGLKPLVTLKYRQEFLNRAPASPDKLRWVKAAVEVEADALPASRVTQRLYTEVAIPQLKEPTIIESSFELSGVRLAHLNRSNPQPRFVLGIHQALFGGTGFIRADSGPLVTPYDVVNDSLFDFSKIKQHMFSGEVPFRPPPSVELGFTTTPVAKAMQSSISLQRGGGMRELAEGVNSSPDGSWAISASATHASVTGFVRYSKDLTLPFFTPRPTKPRPAARLEVELCSNAIQDQYLALRNLWSIGALSKLGFELGISMHNFHLSVHWSRLGQRISVPLLISPKALLSSGIVFWAGVLPFTGLAAWQLSTQYLYGSWRQERSKRFSTSAKAQLSAARRRYEADNITILLAQPVEARQKKQMSLGGLVILSARFGVPDEQGNWVGENVADVSIALAALVEDSGDNSHLVIPKGVRKSRIPGFWDPALGKVKTLHVEYSWKGAEGAVEVTGRDELRLPPVPTPKE